MACFSTASAKDGSEQSVDLPGGMKTEKCFGGEKKNVERRTNLTSDPKFVQLKLSKCRCQWPYRLNVGASGRTV